MAAGRGTRDVDVFINPSGCLGLQPLLLWGTLMPPWPCATAGLSAAPFLPAEPAESRGLGAATSPREATLLASPLSWVGFCPSIPQTMPAKARQTTR